MIKGRGGASLIASSCGTKLFLVAGFAGKEMDDIYIYDIKSKTWTYLKDVTLPDPRSVCVSAGLQVGNFSITLILKINRRNNISTLTA